MPAQIELLILLAVVLAGAVFVIRRVRAGALDEERARQVDSDPGEAVNPDESQDDPADAQRGDDDGDGE